MGKNSRNTKSLIGVLACAAFPLTGWAQSSSLQIYGVMDLGLSSYRAEGAGSRQMLTSSGNQASRIGFRGYESLGDGMGAGFDMEAGLNADTGTGQVSNTNNQPSGATSNSSGALTFNRKSFLYLRSQSLGEIRLGRDYTPAFWNMFLYDPFRVGVGMSAHVLHGTTVTSFRASNSVGYLSPGCSGPGCKGLFFQGMIAFGENSGGPDRQNGRVYGARAGYGGKNWDAAVGVATTLNKAADDYAQYNAAASYLWQDHKFMVLVGENRTGNRIATLDNADRVRFWQLGAVWKLGAAGNIPMSFMRLTRNDASGSSSQKYAMGYVHNLSKRTALYGTYTYVDNKGSINLPVATGSLSGPIPVPGGNASGFDLGLRHSF